MLLGALLIGALGLSLSLGSIHFTPGTLLSLLLGSEGASELHRQILFDFRIPQTLTALLAGAALGLAGLLMQTVFRNPLADPFVLGVNSGASLGVALVLLVVTPMGIHLTDGLVGSSQLLLILASSGGAGLTLFIILLLSRRVDVMALLIIGLMLSYAIGAMVSMLMFFSMADQLQSFINWSFGDFGNVSWPQMRFFAPAVCLAIVFAGLFMKPLDALLQGDQYAQSIGTPVHRVRFLVLASASLLAGTVTGFCGPIGFLGIAAPHLCRYMFRTSAHRVLMPASILTGGTLAVGADLVARGPGLEAVFPLNAITAIVGAPVIVAALIRQRRLKQLF
jgi:iron complex transport system permease protein